MFVLSFFNSDKSIIVVILSVVITVYSNGTTRPTSCILFPKPIRSMTFSVDSFKRSYIKLETSTEMCPISRSLLYSPVAYFSFAMASSRVCVFFLFLYNFFCPAIFEYEMPSKDIVELYSIVHLKL